MHVTQSGSSFLITWDLTTPQEVTITRTSDTPETVLATVPLSVTQYIDTVPGLAEGDEVSWTLVGNVTMDSYDLEAVALDPDDYAYTYGVVDPLVDAIRYTTLAKVKERLGVSSTAKDDALTAAIIAAEIQLDQHLGRSFPDTGTNPEINGIPAPIAEAALHIAMGVWKMGDAPTGSAGSDSWLGEVDVAQQVRREFARNPLLVGYQVGFGFA